MKREQSLTSYRAPGRRDDSEDSEEDRSTANEEPQPTPTSVKRKVMVCMLILS